MRKNSIECDACCKAHPVEDTYDADNLPQGWYTVVPGQGGGFKETVHFCSTKCLIDWAEKQTFVSKKFDAEGPVEGVVMSVEKHQGRLIAKRKEDCEYWREY